MFVFQVFILSLVSLILRAEDVDSDGRDPVVLQSAVDRMTTELLGSQHECALSIKVVDELGRPVQKAEVSFSFVCVNPRGVDVRNLAGDSPLHTLRRTAMTNDQGVVVADDVAFIEASVWLSKVPDGYIVGVDGQQANTLIGQSNFRENPSLKKVERVFSVRRRGAVEPLVSWHSKLKLVSDGSPVSWSTLSRGVDHGPSSNWKMPCDFEVQVWRDPSVLPTDFSANPVVFTHPQWWVQLTGKNGGLLKVRERSGDIPAEGYSPLMRWDMSATNVDYQSGISDMLYWRREVPDHGPVFGIIRVRAGLNNRANEMYVELDLVMNPTGSRVFVRPETESDFPRAEWITPIPDAIRALWLKR